MVPTQNKLSNYIVNIVLFGFTKFTGLNNENTFVDYYW